MSRIIVATVLIVLLAVAGVLLITRTDNIHSSTPVNREAESRLQQSAASVDQGIATTDTLAATGAEIETAACDLRQLESLQQYNRDNLQRLESSILSPEAVASYRGLTSDDLTELARQGDSLAMMMAGMQLLFVSMGRNPELAIDYFYYGMPISELVPHPDGVPSNSYILAFMARNLFTEAALRGRHAAFTFIGLTYTAQNRDAIELDWITQEAYDTLDDAQKNSLEPRVAYSHLAYIIDRNLLPAGSPDRQLFDDRYEQLGEHARFLDELEADFRERLALSNREFPGLPSMTYPDVDQDVIAACEDEGHSQWPR